MQGGLAEQKRLEEVGGIEAVKREGAEGCEGGKGSSKVEGREVRD